MKQVLTHGRCNGTSGPVAVVFLHILKNTFADSYSQKSKQQPGQHGHVSSDQDVIHNLLYQQRRQHIHGSCSK